MSVDDASLSSIKHVTQGLYPTERVPSSRRLEISHHSAILRSPCQVRFEIDRGESRDLSA